MFMRGYWCQGFFGFLIEDGQLDGAWQTNHGSLRRKKIANKAETFVTMMGHVKHDNRENNKLILVHCLIFQHIHPTSSTGMNNIEFSIHHLASWRISSPREVAPLSPSKISPSVSLLDSEWRNMRDSTIMEFILSSKGQFASSELSINCNT